MELLTKVGRQLPIWGRKAKQFKHQDLLFSVNISYGKGKYLNQTVFFTKLAKN